MGELGGELEGYVSSFGTGEDWSESVFCTRGGDLEEFLLETRVGVLTFLRVHLPAITTLYKRGKGGIKVNISSN